MPVLRQNVVRTCAALVAAIAIPSLASAASDSRTVAVVQANLNGLSDSLAIVNSRFAEGLRKGALCYNVLEHDDIRSLLTLEEWRELFGSESNSDQTLQAVQGYAGAPYAGMLSFGKVGSVYTMYAVLLDTKAGRAVARTSRTSEHPDDFFDLVVQIGEEFGRKLPCYVRIEGKRQIDLSKVPEITSGRFAPNMALFRALAPMTLGDVQLSGLVTETDTIDFQPQFSSDHATMTGQATWKAVVDAPSIALHSTEADSTSTRAPYTLSFKENVSGPYDQSARKAHFDEDLSEQAPQANGAGTVQVVLKDRLGALGQVADALSQAVQQLTGTDVKATVLQQNAAQDPNFHMSSDLRSGTATLPDPKMQDAVYFKLSFDVELARPDDAHVTGSDEMGTYDYVVHISATPGGE